MLKEEIFINKLDGVKLKRIYIDGIELDDERTHCIKEIFTDRIYDEIIVLPNVSISNYKEIILE